MALPAQAVQWSERGHAVEDTVARLRQKPQQWLDETTAARSKA